MRALLTILLVASLETELAACSVLPSSITSMVNASWIHGVVVGAPIEVDTLSARFRVDASLDARPTAETISLVTLGPEDGGSCYSPLTFHYDIDHRFLLMLPEVMPDGSYIAPKRWPWLIRLDAEPSDEERLFTDYVNDAIAHDREPISVALQPGSIFVSGRSMPLRVTVTNHMDVPLSLFDRDRGSRPLDQLRFDLYFGADEGCLYCEDEEVPLAPEVTVPPNSNATVTVDLARVYGIQKPGEYVVRGFVDVPVAPGRSYRDWAMTGRLFTVLREDPDAAVLPVSWGSVKDGCCGSQRTGAKR